MPEAETRSAPEDSYGTAVRPRPKRSYVWLWVLFGLAVIAICSVAVAATVLNIRLEHNEGGWSLHLQEQKHISGTDTVRDLPVSNGVDSAAQTAQSPENPIRLHLAQGDAAASADTATELYRNISRSVVCLEVSTYYGTYSLTGIVLSEDGYLLTAVSELGGISEFSAVFSDGSTCLARRVDSDRVTGLTLLKAEASGLTPVTFSTDDVSVGQRVYLISNPYGSTMPNVLSEGMISAVQTSELEGESYRLLLTSSPRQSEGGGIPVFDEKGRLTGLTTPISQWLLSGKTDPCFALSSADLQREVDALTLHADAYDGIGLRVEEISSGMISYYRFPGRLWITQISPGSPAYGYLAVNDVITEVNGTAVSTIDEYEKALAEAVPTGHVVLTIYRSGVYYYARISVNQA